MLFTNGGTKQSERSSCRLTMGEESLTPCSQQYESKHQQYDGPCFCVDSDHSKLAVPRTPTPQNYE